LALLVDGGGRMDLVWRFTLCPHNLKNLLRRGLNVVNELIVVERLKELEEAIDVHGN
jgi:hypothetical protein